MASEQAKIAVKVASESDVWTSLVDTLHVKRNSDYMEPALLNGILNIPETTLKVNCITINKHHSAVVYLPAALHSNNVSE